MAPRPSHANDDIDLAALFGALRRSLPTVLIASIAMGALTFFALSLIAPRYTSEAQLAIVSKRTNPFPDQLGEQRTADTLASRLDREAINTHVKALMAPELLLRVADQLNLSDRAEFNPSVGPVDTMDRILRTIGMGNSSDSSLGSDSLVEAMKSRLMVAAARESRFISIQFTSVDPELAAQFANRLASRYRESLVEVPIQETNQVIDALLPKIQQLNDEVVAAETAVEDYRAKTDQFLTGPEQVPINSQRLNSLTDELSRAESARAEAEARWTTAQGLARSGNAEVLPEVRESNVIQELISQRVRLERQVNEARVALLPAHPRMIQLNADLRGLNRAIAGEVRRVIESLEKSYRSAKLRVDDISRQISTLKTQVASTSGEDARLKALISTAKSKREELERLQRQLEDNKTLVVTKTVPIEAQIVSNARPASERSFPKSGPIAALVSAATFLLGMALSAASAIISGGHAPARGPEPYTGRVGTGGRPGPRGGARQRPARSPEPDDAFYDDVEPDFEPEPEPAVARASAERFAHDEFAHDAFAHDDDEADLAAAARQRFDDRRAALQERSETSSVTSMTSRDESDAYDAPMHSHAPHADDAPASGPRHAARQAPAAQPAPAGDNPRARVSSAAASVVGAATAAVAARFAKGADKPHVADTQDSRPVFSIDAARSRLGLESKAHAHEDARAGDDHDDAQAAMNPHDRAGDDAARRHSDAAAQWAGELQSQDGGTTLDDVADRIAGRANNGIGFRTMVVASAPGLDPSEEAIDVALGLAERGASVILVDCSLDGRGVLPEFDEAGPGLVDLLQGEASFEDVVTVLPETEVHTITCGSELADGEGLDPDTNNLVLDALDEAYDHIVVVGHHRDAKHLFETIQGRFDAGVSISDRRRDTTVLEEPAASFLGFEVTDIDVIRYERSQGRIMLPSEGRAHDMGAPQPA